MNPTSNIVIAAQSFPPRSGGKQSLMEALAAHAQAAGARVTVFADGKNGDAAYDKAQNKAYNIQRIGGIKPLRQRRMAKAVASFAAKNETGAIFCDSWRSAEKLPQNLNCPVIVYAHGNEYPREGEPDYAAKLARIPKVLSKVDVLIAVSDDTKNRAAAFTPKSCRAQVIHNPISASIDPSAEDLAYAQTLWPHADKTRCLTLSRLVAWKGIDRAIEAVAAHKDCQLVIAGDGEDLAKLQALAAQHGAQDCVVFAGRVEGGRKSALFASADIFMQPGRNVDGQYEGYGLTYIEAGLQGLPSISGNQGGAPEAVIHEKTGLVVDAAETEPVTLALGQLLRDVPLRESLGVGAKQHAHALLWPRKIEQILALATSQALDAAPLAHCDEHNYVEGQESPAQ